MGVSGQRHALAALYSRGKDPRYSLDGRAMAQAVSRRPLTASPGFTPGTIHVGFVVDKVALGQFFLRLLRVFPCQYHSTVVLHTHTSSGG
jgi:hypothetical protein